MYEELKQIYKRPRPFERYTADTLWTDPHTSRQMLDFHLDESIDLSSRNSDFIDRSVEWIVSRFDVNAHTTIADFGCGPGLYTSRFAQHGAQVTGIDFSSGSIQYAKDNAREQGLEITYVHQNYLEFDTKETFDLITMIFCDFCALSPEQRGVLLEKFRRFLKPGGAVLLDVHSLNTFSAREEISICEHNQLNGFWSADDYYAFLSVYKYDREAVTLDKYTIVEEARTREVYNWLQYFSPESLRTEFESKGFKVEAMYSDVAGKPLVQDSPDIAIVAR